MIFPGSRNFKKIKQKKKIVVFNFFLFNLIHFLLFIKKKSKNKKKDFFSINISNLWKIMKNFFCLFQWSEIRNQNGGSFRDTLRGALCHVSLVFGSKF